MNKRLVWNFEINTDNPLDLQALPHEEKEEIRWEARFFWPEDQIITLYGLEDSFFDLSTYQAKRRQDSYSLLSNLNYNIKRRRLQLLYKPLLKKTDYLQGYGKKINLADYPADEVLPGTDNVYTPTLFAQLKDSQTIDVIKDTLTYKFPLEPAIKLELARLLINKKIYFSACIEGRSQLFVKTLANHLLKKQISCDYVSFLKQTLKS